VQVSFDPLWERLLEGGVRRRAARRYLTELREHLDDLIANERRAVGDPQDAETRALSRLGSFEMLAEAMIERRELQTWSRKAPFAAYLIAPSVALAAGTALAVVGVVLTVKGFQGGANAAGQLPDWLEQVASAVVVLSHTLLPIVLAWALGAMAFRQRSPWLWPVGGIVLLVVLGTAVQVGLTLPSPTTHGEVSIRSGFGASPGEFVAFAGRLGLALLPYATLRLWGAARDRQSA
jgi:hypothetical protein